MSVKSVLLVSLALVLLYSSGSILWSEYEAKQWPQTEAVILSVEAKVKDSVLVDQRHRVPEVLYTYEVAGATYNSNRVSLDPEYLNEIYSTFGLEHPNERYKVGEALIVHYNPSAPGEAILREHVSRPVYFVFMVGTLLFFGSLLSMLSSKEED